jgi:SAM-dependent methyltransferase
VATANKIEKEKNAGGSKAYLPGLTVKDGYTRHPFDLKYGVRTSGLVAGRNLKIGHAHDRHITAYYGVAPSVFQRTIARWRRTHPIAPLDEYTFVDFGAGMGRAVLLASEMSFRAIVGVEIHPTLAGVARRNAALWRKAGRELAPIRIRCCDALNFPLPKGPCLGFLFNPFGAPVLRRLLAAAARRYAGRPGAFDLIYVNDEQASVFKKNANYRRLFGGKVMRSQADAIADHRILAAQPDGEYASSNSEDCSIYRLVNFDG